MAEKKLNEVLFGVKGLPYPVMMSDPALSSDEKVLGLLQTDPKEEKPLYISTEMSPSRVYGDLLRNMPSPSMLNLMHDGIRDRMPDSDKKIDFFMGTAGSGKTHLATSLGKIRNKKGPVVVSCGDKNIEELMFKTVLDVGGDRSIYDKIDDKIKEYNNPSIDESKKIKSPSLDLLKNTLGKAFKQDEDGKVSIDWRSVSAESVAKESEGTEKASARITGALKDFCEIEGINADKNSLGLKVEEGPIIQAWKEGREIVLDEYNKHKPGTDGIMQVPLQFFAGEIDKCSVEVGEKSFTFDRKKMPKGFFVTMTGNDASDGVSTTELSASVYSRVAPKKVGDPTQEDMEHRIGQIMTGLPITTLYKANKGYWDKNPKEFSSYLKKARVLGLSDEEVKNIPQTQFKMFDNWDNVVEACGNLSKFYKGWQERTNPESKFYEDGDYEAMEEEVEGNYYRQTAVDMRKIRSHIKKAFLAKPEPSGLAESHGFSLDDLLDESKMLRNKEEETDLVKSYGANLVDAIESDFQSSSIDTGRKHLYKSLKKLAQKTGIVDVSDMHEGEAKQGKTIKDLLSFDSEKEESREAKKVRDILCTYLRKKYPDISDNNDEILTPKTAEESLKVIREEDKDRNLDDYHSYLYVPNQNLEEFIENPFQKALSTGSMSEEAQKVTRELSEKVEQNPEREEEITEEGREKIGKSTVNIESGDLVDARALMFSFAFSPKLAKANLDALWKKEEILVYDDERTQHDYLIASNKDYGKGEDAENHTGIAVNTVTVKDSEKESGSTFINVVKNKKGVSLFVGNFELEDEVKKALKQNNIIYANANNDKDLQKIDSFVDNMKDKKISGFNEDDLEKALNEAFGRRVDSIGDFELSDRSFKENIKDFKNIVTYSGNFVSKAKDKKQLNTMIANARNNASR